VSARDASCVYSRRREVDSTGVASATKIDNTRARSRQLCVAPGVTGGTHTAPSARQAERPWRHLGTSKLPHGLAAANGLQELPCAATRHARLSSHAQPTAARARDARWNVRTTAETRRCGAWHVTCRDMTARDNFSCATLNRHVTQGVRASTARLCSLQRAAACSELAVNARGFSSRRVSAAADM